MSKRVFNFNPGPAVLPVPALERARDEFMDFSGSGMSVLESSHRSKEYDAVHHEAMALVKELLGLPADYHVLFLQGGASLQFAMVPMNLLGAGMSADYVITGSWSKLALKEAKILGAPKVAASSEQDSFTYIPTEFTFDPDAAYVHITSNNTIGGTQYHGFPNTGSVPIVADMSSDIMWRQFDVKPFGLIYAGAQKNMGPAGVTLVIIRDDVLQKCRPGLPTMLSYGTHVTKESLHNTCPVFSIYMVRNVLAWVKDQGGLPAMEKHNRRKGDMLYAALDSDPDFFRAPVRKDSRSYMNVVFRLPTEDLEAAFITEAKKLGMVGLKGHRSVGGIRASLYNALPHEAVQSLVDFMQDFRKRS
ncbi:3-phosphoserine/phosphohydroxythreonine transaminase [Candidatus Fermentibacteria bacterium]|nr:3-phosphoserine/phosphohydroxythreonine transaminase [Candidatus Fermentibacteria bacterium]